MGLNELMHYGTPRHSGRYPWGSGDNPYQRTEEFKAKYKEMQKRGLDYTAMAKEMGVSSGYIRTMVSLSNKQERTANITRCQRLKDKGYSNTKIAELMGTNESTVRGWLKAKQTEKENKAEATAALLKAKVGKDSYIDVGSGVEKVLGISSEKMDVALQMLEDSGYSVVKVRIKNATDPNVSTITKLLVPPGVTAKDVHYNLDKIKSFEEYSHDNGETFKTIQPPVSVDSSRIKVRYNEEGGQDRDGTIEIRRGVADIDLGNSSYAQVRIGVDGTHYMKGMAFYSDDMPDGVDIIYNSNKHIGAEKDKVFKPMKDDPVNPFGSYIPAKGQSYYKDPKTGEEKLSCINKVKEEGDWEHYSKSLSSQFLSKQNLSLIKRQLDLSYDMKKNDFDEIKTLTNPEIKKEFLESFADECDKAAVDLKAAALPRQSSKVILPVPQLKDNEVYAPTYNNGEKIALVRFPHGGTFEIPILTVNNNNPNGKSIVGPKAVDAIGINVNVAARLSGADFDGDTVLTIPVNDHVKIKTQAPLKGLEGFNPSDAFPKTDGMKILSKAQTQIEMGIVSNLITDMTLKGAQPDELARAVRHSMVVIDANKHELNYKLSEEVNGIKALKKKYQSNPDNPNKFGASTLISRAKGEIRIDEVKESYKPDPETGEYIKTATGREYAVYKKNPDGSYAKDENGKYIVTGYKKAQTKLTKMEATDDAFTLSSGTKTENEYAAYANKLKAMAKEARKELAATPSSKADQNAKKKYSEEVKSLTDKVNEAIKNQPKERMAQVRANRIINEATTKDPSLKLKAKKDDLMKLRVRAIAESRGYYGAKSSEVLVKISDKEWEAIQNGAIGSTLMSSIIRYGDKDVLRQKATPRATLEISDAKQNRIKTLRDSGYTIAQIAKATGVSSSTVTKYMNE